MKGVQGTDERRAQLDAWMDERRTELRLRWSHVARRARMTVENLLRIRKGRISISWEAAKGIDDALQWERGGVEAAVLNGVKPTPRDDDDTAPAESTSETDSVVWTSEMEAFYQILKAKFKAEGLEMNERNVLSAIDQLRIELARRVGSQDRIPNDTR